MPAKVMPLGLPSESLFQKVKAPLTASSVPQLAVSGALAFKPLVNAINPPPARSTTGSRFSMLLNVALGKLRSKSASPAATGQGFVASKTRANGLFNRQ